MKIQKQINHTFAGQDANHEVKPHLSCREKQVVALLMQAKANKEIASHLNLAEGTVKEYLNRVFRKLKMGSRTELAVWAHQTLHESSTDRTPESVRTTTESLLCEDAI